MNQIDIIDQNYMGGHTDTAHGLQLVLDLVCTRVRIQTQPTGSNWYQIWYVHGWEYKHSPRAPSGTRSDMYMGGHADTAHGFQLVLDLVCTWVGIQAQPMDSNWY